MHGGGNWGYWDATVLEPDFVALNADNACRASPFLPKRSSSLGNSIHHPISAGIVPRDMGGFA
eukprot:2197221-Amphidinium_carterae.1